MSGFTSSMFSKHATLELLLSRLHWSEVDLQLLVVPAGDSHASHVSRVRGRPRCPGPPVSAGRHQGWVTPLATSGHGLSCSPLQPGAALRGELTRGRGLAGDH